MASIPINDRTSPQPLPSLPPSPTISEDLSRAQAWAEQDDEKAPQKKDKGKSKEVINLNIEEGGSGDTSEDEASGSYPPTNEDAAETRRIEDVSLGEKDGSSRYILTTYDSRTYANGKWQSVSGGRLRGRAHKHHPDRLWRTSRDEPVYYGPEKTEMPRARRVMSEAD